MRRVRRKGLVAAVLVLGVASFQLAERPAGCSARKSRRNRDS
jgi:hypothetical protein